MADNIYALLQQAWSVSKTTDANLYGVEVAIVTNVKDPEKQGRVKICFPRLPGKPESDWARIAQLAAGSGRGFYWLPEVNDEVLVAFERGQANLPYVIGALWNGQDKPMRDAYTDENTTRMIQTRSGHQIVLDDKSGEEKITFADKTGKRTLTFDVKEKKFLVEAKEGDVEIHAERKLVLECEDLEIKTKKSGKFDIGSTFDLNVAEKAQFKAGPRMNLKADQVQLNPSSGGGGGARGAAAGLRGLMNAAAAAAAAVARGAAAAAPGPGSDPLPGTMAALREGRTFTVPTRDVVAANVAGLRDNVAAGVNQVASAVVEQVAPGATEEVKKLGYKAAAGATKLADSVAADATKLGEAAAEGAKKLAEPVVAEAVKLAAPVVTEAVKLAEPVVAEAVKLAAPVVAEVKKLADEMADRAKSEIHLQLVDAITGAPVAGAKWKLLDDLGDPAKLNGAEILGTSDAAGIVRHDVAAPGLYRLQIVE